MNLLEKVELSKLIVKHSLLVYPKVFAAVSFGKDSRILIDLIMSIDADFQFIGIDTGYEFAETLDHGKTLANELKMNFKWMKPSKEDRRKIDKEYGDSFIKNDQYKCCEMKIPAIEKVLGNYSAWITGLRRDETEYRKNTKLIEEGSIAKINPIAFWTKDEVWEYIKQFKLKYHPLYDEGYASLGCEPCTKRGKTRKGGGKQGRFERAGRFKETGNRGGECGLHLA